MVREQSMIQSNYFKSGTVLGVPHQRGKLAWVQLRFGTDDKSPAIDLSENGGYREKGKRENSAWGREGKELKIGRVGLVKKRKRTAPMWGARKRGKGEEQEGASAGMKFVRWSFEGSNGGGWLLS